MRPAKPANPAAARRRLGYGYAGAPFRYSIAVAPSASEGGSWYCEVRRQRFGPDDRGRWVCHADDLLMRCHILDLPSDLQELFQLIGRW